MFTSSTISSYVYDLIIQLHLWSAPSFETILETIHLLDSLLLRTYRQLNLRHSTAPTFNQQRLHRCYTSTAILHPCTPFEYDLLNKDLIFNLTYLSFSFASQPLLIRNHLQVQHIYLSRNRYFTDCHITLPLFFEVDSLSSALSIEQ